jgi:hypothetical protein
LAGASFNRDLHLLRKRSPSGDCVALSRPTVASKRRIDGSIVDPCSDEARVFTLPELSREFRVVTVCDAGNVDVEELPPAGEGLVPPDLVKPTSEFVMNDAERLSAGASDADQ